jgi:hypothetical protein
MQFVQNITIDISMLWQSSFFKMVPAEFVKGATLASLAITICLLASTFFYLLQSRRFSKKNRQARNAFGSFLSDIILSESLEELNAVLRQERVQKINGKWLARSFGRKVLTNELMKIHRSMSGQAGENIVWLYRHFELHRDSLKNFHSTSWHRKALAIQEFSETKQTQYLQEIYEAANDSNEFIRTEAQIALVKLTGFEGLNFLSIVQYPITQWQQLCLLQQLAGESQLQWNQLPAWLQSKNETVAEFALRLAEHYKCYEVHDAVTSCLQHSSAAIRRQTIHTLKEICQEHTVKLLEEHFITAEKEEQLYVLEALRYIGGSDQISFLVCLLHQDDDTIKYAAVKLIQQLSNDWYDIVQQHIKPRQSSLHYVIAELKKEEAA